MLELDLMTTLRDRWLSQAVTALTRGASTTIDTRAQLEYFYRALSKTVETGDLDWLNSTIRGWSVSLTQTDLENSSISLSSILKELTLVTLRTVRECLPLADALELINTLLPLLSQAQETAARLEVEAKVEYYKTELSQVRQSLEKIDQSKSDFISVAAHELKTPLTLIDGYASMLRENLEQAGLLPQQTMLVDGILNGTRRMRSIVDDMIDVTLIDNNLLALNFQPVWINRLLVVLADELSQPIKERRQQISVRAFPGANEMTFADPERILQVLRNVLTNAVKYTPDGGQINVDGRKLPGFIEVTVHDTGIGIDPDDAQYIFDKFVRLGNTALHSSSKTKFKGGGPGLGLHIARGIIEAHGGAIWAESEGFSESSCPGSTFHILIPLRTSPPDARMAKLFAPLIQQNKNKVEAKS